MEVLLPKTSVFGNSKVSIKLSHPQVQEIELGGLGILPFILETFALGDWHCNGNDTNVTKQNRRIP